MTVYGSVYRPLMAKVKPNQRDFTQVVGFIGPQLCFFENGIVYPDVGEEVHVMVTRAMYRKTPLGSLDHDRLLALAIRPVSAEQHAMIAIDGFTVREDGGPAVAKGVTTVGSDPVTISHRARRDRVRPGRTGQDDLERRVYTLKPGNTGALVSDDTYCTTSDASVSPSNVWVDRHLLDDYDHRTVSIAGLASLDHARWSHLVRRFRH